MTLQPLQASPTLPAAALKPAWSFGSFFSWAESAAACPIESTLPFDTRIDESCILKNPQLQRNRAEGHIGHGRRNLSGLQFLAPDQTKDFTPPGRSDGIDRRVGHGVNLYKTKI